MARVRAPISLVRRGMLYLRRGENPLARLWEGLDPPPDSVMFEGEPVWSGYELELKDGDRLRIVFERAKQIIAAQGLNLEFENGALFVEDRPLKHFDLWADDVPRGGVEGTVVAHRAGDAVYLELYHQWRWYDTDYPDAWLAAYGLRVDRDGNELTLRCNAGYSKPKFADLVAKLSIAGGEPDERLRKHEVLLVRGPKNQRRGSAKRNWKAMGDKKLVAAIEELRRGRGRAYEMCVIAGGDPDAELARAEAALLTRRRS